MSFWVIIHFGDKIVNLDGVVIKIYDGSVPLITAQNQPTGGFL